MKPQNAIRLLVYLISAVMVFHLCILFKLIPYDITWGGRLKNDTEMYGFETVSIVLNGVLLLALLGKGGFVKSVFGDKTTRVILWIFFALFAINTVGNLIAETTFEKTFALLTLASSILLWIVLRGKDKSPGE